MEVIAWLKATGDSLNRIYVGFYGVVSGEDYDCTFYLTIDYHEPMPVIRSLPHFTFGKTAIKHHISFYYVYDGFNDEHRVTLSYEAVGDFQLHDYIFVSD